MGQGKTCNMLSVRGQLLVLEVTSAAVLPRPVAVTFVWEFLDEITIWSDPLLVRCAAAAICCCAVACAVAFRSCAAALQ